MLVTGLQGDWMWAMAGETHGTTFCIFKPQIPLVFLLNSITKHAKLIGPIRNKGAVTLRIYAIGTSMKLKHGNVSRSNPTVDPLKNRTRFCKYGGGSTDLTEDSSQRRGLDEGPGGLGCDYSGPHTADRVSWGAGGYAPCASMPGHPEGSCLQAHYHPKGALYIGLAGRTFYAQDYDGFDVSSQATQPTVAISGHFLTGCLCH